MVRRWDKQLNKKQIMSLIIQHKGNCYTIACLEFGRDFHCDNCFIRRRCRFLEWLYNFYIAIFGHNFKRVGKKLMDQNKITGESLSKYVHKLLYNKTIKKYIKIYGEEKLFEELL